MSRRRAQDRAPALPSSSAKAAIITGTARKNAIGRACVRSFLKVRLKCRLGAFTCCAILASERETLVHAAQPCDSTYQTTQHTKLSERLLDLPQAGYTVVGIDKNTPEGLDTDAVLQQHASSLQFIEADLTDEVQLEDAAKRACTWLGRVNVLVNNAGITQPYMPGTRQERSKLWHSYMATNLTGGLVA